MILKLKADEVNLSAATNVSSANVVRIYNKDTADHVITNSNGYSFTLPGGAITFVDKLPAETLTAGDANCVAVSVSYNIS